MPGQPGYGGPPPQQGFGAPPQGYGAPPQPGYGAPPPGFSAPGQPGYGAPPPGFPGGPGGPPPKKGGRSGLIIIIVIVLLVIIIGGVLAFVFLGGKKNTGNTPGSSATNTPAATATQAVPSGFKTFSNADFSVIYPQDWKTKTTSSGAGEQFSSTTGQVFEVDITKGASDAAAFDTAYCGAIGKVTAGPTAVTIGGAQWTREECEDKAGSFHTVVESVTHNSNLFSIAYLSLAPTYAVDKSQFYQPMEQSFKFLS